MPMCMVLDKSPAGTRCIAYAGCCHTHTLPPCSAREGLRGARRPDLEFIRAQVDKTAIERLEAVAATPFERITYTRAIEILQEVVAAKKKKFEFKARRLACMRRRSLECLCRLYLTLLAWHK